MIQKLSLAVFLFLNSSCLFLENNYSRNSRLSDEEKIIIAKIKSCTDIETINEWSKKQIRSQLLRNTSDSEIVDNMSVTFPNLGDHGTHVETWFEKIEGIHYCINDVFTFVDFYSEGTHIGRGYVGMTLYFSLDDNTHRLSVHTAWYESSGT